MFRIRTVPESNYRAIFNGKDTIRLLLNPREKMGALKLPEITDIGLNSKCFANCPQCYVAALNTGVNFDRIVEKIYDYYGNLPEEHRPFQVAIGGSGEPTLHPDFVAALEAFHSLGIVPNYTTNGMHLTPTILEATKRLGCSVAVSCHPHLDKVWRAAISRFKEYDIPTCVHIIVGEPGSAARFHEIVETVPDILYYVALPYRAVGRAKDIPVEQEWDKLFDHEPVPNAAFGAYFYDYFLTHPEVVERWGADLYEPEIFSAYQLLDDSYRVLRVSSFDPTPKE